MLLINKEVGGFFCGEGVVGIGDKVGIFIFNVMKLFMMLYIYFEFKVWCSYRVDNEFLIRF